MKIKVYFCMILSRSVSCVSMKRKFVWCMLWGVLLMSCNRSKVVSDVDYPNDSVTDSLFDSPDSLIFSSEPATEEELPKTADELFDDFIFEFARLPHLQLKRVAFPLPQIAGEDTTWLPKEEWKFESLFLNRDYYTVLFSSEGQMEWEKRTDLNCVDLEWIFLDEQQFKVYRFERLSGKWMLTEERVRPFRESSLADFLNFYAKFSTDLEFQLLSVSDPLRYVTTDPDDDFNVIEGMLDHDQWEAFKPQLPKNVITNIRYGQTYDRSNSVLLVKQGISNGMMDILTFRKGRAGWKLVAYEN